MSTTSIGPHTTSDLPILNGVASHLGIRADDLAPAIFIVGDPERADRIARQQCEATEMRASHRGVTTRTICIAAANRALDTFESDIASRVSDAVRVALRALPISSRNSQRWR